MKISTKLKLIQKISNLTQTELAQKLKVTFAAFNRWINEQSVPRTKTLEKINELYREYTGQKEIPESVFQVKKNILFQKSKSFNILKIILKNPDIRDQFLLALTYHSNGIEGSTLSENETAAILFNNASLSNKSLTEQLEAKNHQTALEYLFKHLTEKKLINEKLILKLHSILMNAIHSDAGLYRNHGVRIVGTYVPTANWQKIPSLMKELIKKINSTKNDIISHASFIHAQFEQIHPFADGNGRIGRLLIQAMLLKNNLSPAIILQKNKQLYNLYLNKAQLNSDISLLEDFICEAIFEGYKIVERKN